MLEQILLANPRGFCAGVIRAIETVDKALVKYGMPIYVRHEIIHNEHVTNSLAQKGAVFVDSLDNVPRGSRLIFSAHGVAPSVREEADERDLHTIDATCPLVTKVHFEAKRYANAGYGIILIGHSGHVEVQGVMGEAQKAIYVIRPEVKEAEEVQIPNPDKVACLSQTTLSVDETEAVLNILRRRFPSIAVPKKGDICYATTNRQLAVKELAQQGVEAVLVVGSPNSSNTARLAEVASDCKVNAYRISDCSELKPDWLAGIQTVGITAGASTPEYLITDVVEYLRRLSLNVKVKEMRGIPENVSFALPET